MPIVTRLTKRLGITHPVLSAPMAMAAGGRLAAAVSNAGGLGLIGGGYGDETWFCDQFLAAGNAVVGCGFISWSLRRQPHLLDLALERRPKVIFLSFDDPAEFAPRIRAFSFNRCKHAATPNERSTSAPAFSWRKGPKQAGTGRSALQ